MFQQKLNGKWNAASTDNSPTVVSSQITQVVPIKPAVSPNQPMVRKCFNCQSTSHLIGQCPTREECSFQGAKGAPPGHNNTSYGGGNMNNNGRYPRQWFPRNTGGATVSSMTVDAGMGSDDHRPVNQSVAATAACSHIAINETDTSMTVSGVSDKWGATNANPSITVNESDRDIAGVDHTKNILRLAGLNFINVNVGTDDNTIWKALDDGGSEINVVSRDRLVALSIPCKSVGAVVLRQVSGPTINAEFVSLPVRIARPTPRGVNHTEYVTIIAASCDQMSHDIILCAPIVQILIDR